MKQNNIPKPTVMPVNRQDWSEQLHLSNFINTYYQYRDLQLCNECKKILIIGPGQGLDTLVLKWRNYDVTTFDIDDTFKPDYQGSVHNMSIFRNQQFDAVIASHVLEHLADAYFDIALKEISRVGRYALIYLPVHGRHVQLRFIPGFKALDFSLVFNLFNYFEKPDGVTPKYMSRQHFWEVGMRNYRVKDILKRMSYFFEIIFSYRNCDWLPSYNFLLKSKL